jgi:NAD/NADP transhydrogenase beta subunit
MNDQNGNKERKLAEILDSKFKIPNTNIRFGIDPILGLIPGAGDWLAGIISLYILIQAALQGGGTLVLSRMFINILLDVLIGAIPVIGEIFDVYWKSNIRNAKILQELRSNPEKTTTENRLWVWLVVVQFVILIFGTLFLLTWLVAKLLQLLF